MERHLKGSHRRTYEAIFRHPAAHNLEWRHVRALLNVLTEVVEEPSGHIRVSRNGQSAVLHPPRHKDVAGDDELMEIRHFLERSREIPLQSAAEGTHLLVVIDHRQARIYQTELHGSVPQRVTPYDPHGFGRHLHYVQDDSNGQRKPELKSYYEAVAKTLGGAERILLFGAGTGASSAMEQLLAELKQHHGDVAAHVVGSIAVDEQHLTEDQLLAQARAFYAASRPLAVQG